MKFCRLIFTVILSFFLISCVSAIPGEKSVILHNISAEYFAIAENYLAQKNYSKAIDNYKLSLRSAKKEDVNQIKYQMGYAYALSEKYSEAEDIFVDLYKQEKSNRILAESLAYCYAKNRKLDDALAIYQTLYAENPYTEEIANNYFLVLLEANQIEAAKEVLDKFKEDFSESKKISVLEENYKKITEPKEKPEDSEEIHDTEISEDTENSKQSNKTVTSEDKLE